MKSFEHQNRYGFLMSVKPLLKHGRSEPLPIKDRLSPTEESRFLPALWAMAGTVGLWIIAGILILTSGCQVAHAEVSESQAIKIIVGEAANQGFKGMICVAEVLRRKNSVKGFYGLNAKHSAHESKLVWEMARKAWQVSNNTNYTKLADHFENIHAFGTPCWVKNCVEIFRYKSHVFYREVRNG